jgi:hypothetical protein
LQERQAGEESVVEKVGEPGPEYRYGGLPDGELLTVRFLDDRYGLKGPYITKHTSELSGRAKYGNKHIFAWNEVLALVEARDADLEK